MNGSGQATVSDAVRLAMEKADIPDGAQVIFNLYAVEGFSHKEISEKLQISEGTSKSQVNRARMLLQKYLGDVSV